MTRGEKLYLFVSIVALVAAIAFAFWVSYDVRDTKIKFQEYIESSKDAYTPRDGKDGRDGVTEVITKEVYIPGKDGANGINGMDGKNVTNEQVAKAVSDYFVANPVKPEKGDQGEPGATGLTIFVRQKPLSNSYECLVAGDIIWQPLENCL